MRVLVSEICAPTSAPGSPSSVFTLAAGEVVVWRLMREARVGAVRAGVLLVRVEAAFDGDDLSLNDPLCVPIADDGTSVALSASEGGARAFDGAEFGELPTAAAVPMSVRVRALVPLLT
jgi:hypothetical protein